MFSLQAFVEAEQKRGDCFRFLAACFYRPNREEFHQYGVLEQLSVAMGAVCPGVAAHANGMKEAMAVAVEDELAVEHAKLFIGPFELQAPPYGSVYLDEGNRVMGDSTRGVLDFYRWAGLNLDDGFTELPDHVVVELEFMYFLIHREGSALARGHADTAVDFAKLQSAFMQQHLARWIAPFCLRLRESAVHPFYLSLADRLAAYTERNEQHLQPEALETVLDLANEADRVALEA